MDTQKFVDRQTHKILYPINRYLALRPSAEGKMIPFFLYQSVTICVRFYIVRRDRVRFMGCYNKARKVKVLLVVALCVLFWRLFEMGHPSVTKGLTLRNNSSMLQDVTGPTQYVSTNNYGNIVSSLSGFMSQAV